MFDYKFCSVCNDYRKVQYDMTECSHLFMAQPINIWVGSGCTENKPYFHTLIWTELKELVQTIGWAVLMSAIGTSYNNELLAMVKTIPTSINYDITIDEKTYSNVSTASAKRVKSLKAAWGTVIIKPNYGENDGTHS